MGQSLEDLVDHTSGLDPCISKGPAIVEFVC